MIPIQICKKGGFKTIDKKFGGHLAEIIVELNQYLYEDGGKNSLNTQEIVAKLWNLCNVLRDDGITYHQICNRTHLYFIFENGKRNRCRKKYS